MPSVRPRVVILCNKDAYAHYVDPGALDRLHRFADSSWVECQEGQPTEELPERIGSGDALILCSGAPRISAEIMARLPGLRFIGDMDGDRFAGRIDVETAWERGIKTVDTTNGTSYPVSEWALALIIISLRNAGQHFRNMITGSTRRMTGDPGYHRGDLTGKTVGLIGCGHIGRRLIQFLKPFNTKIFVHDPYLPQEMAEALGFTLTSLDFVLSGVDVVVCLAPLTPRTKGMIGERELNLIPSGTVFVNVSRGAIVDSRALVARLQRGDIIAGLDVFDPEPVPPDSPMLHLSNVFLSPHIAGVTAPSYPRMFSLMVDDMERFFSGHEPYYTLSPRSIANRRGASL